jgi:predicted lipoprotein with Yx(FWY)xxD motif
MFKPLFAALATALFACVALAAGAPAAPMHGVMATPSGATVYTFDKDAAGSGKSACNGPCAKLWPPVMAAADAKAEGEWSVVTRDDGAKQWAYKGRPVYLYASDAKAGDRTGDNFKDVWHVIKP